MVGMDELISRHGRSCVGRKCEGRKSQIPQRCIRNTGRFIVITSGRRGRDNIGTDNAGSNINRLTVPSRDTSYPTIVRE